MIIAKPGDWVCDSLTFKRICQVQYPLRDDGIVRSGDFHNFQGDEKPWLANTPVDVRCFRPRPERVGYQIHLEGGWSP